MSIPSKTILITGSTDGIGLETAKMLKENGHRVLLHGRSESKMEQAKEALGGDKSVPGYLGDLSHRDQVVALAEAVKAGHERLDVLINNAGVFRVPNPRTAGGLDLRFVVNTVAPYLLTKLLLPIIPKEGRVVNLSSAAQAPVGLEALHGRASLGDGVAYAQSKLALTMWSRQLQYIAVNPGSLLGSKMVKEAYGMDGAPLIKGADILCRAALSAEFEGAGGRYFDNDSGRFADPHLDALSAEKVAAVCGVVEELSEIEEW